MKEKRKESRRKETQAKTEDIETAVPAQRDEDSSPALEESHAPTIIVERIDKTEKTLETESTISHMSGEIADSESIVLMPLWGSPDESEWMYGVPPRDEDKILWAEEWADFLLQWAEHNQVHVLSLASFITEPPFKELRNKIDSFKMIAQVLIAQEVAEWTDKRRRQLRIYWRPLEDWMDLIYEWSLRTGKLRLDVKSIVIQESKESFARLPENDLYRILGLMVEKGLAEWIDKKKGAVLISA